MTDTAATDKQQLEHAVEPAADAEVPIESEEQQQAEPGNGQGDEDRPRGENPVFADRARIAARFKAQREQRQDEHAEMVNAPPGEIEGDAPADRPQDAARTIK